MKFSTTKLLANIEAQVDRFGRKFLSDTVARADDRDWFAKHPDRRYRIRLLGTVEAEALREACGPSGFLTFRYQSTHALVVRRAPGDFMPHPLPGVSAGTETPTDEESGAIIYRMMCDAAYAPTRGIQFS